jgi:hypothetical protein
MVSSIRRMMEVHRAVRRGREGVFDADPEGWFRTPLTEVQKALRDASRDRVPRFFNTRTRKGWLAWREWAMAQPKRHLSLYQAHKTGGPMPGLVRRVDPETGEPVPFRLYESGQWPQSNHAGKGKPTLWARGLDEPEKGIGDMADEKVDFTKGGMMAVCLGKGYTIPNDYRFHPQVYLLDTTLNPGELDDLLPSQTRLVLMTDKIPQKMYQYLQDTIRKKRLIHIFRKSDPQIAGVLRSAFPKGRVPVMPESNGNGHGHQAAPPLTAAIEELSEVELSDLERASTPRPVPSPPPSPSPSKGFAGAKTVEEQGRGAVSTFIRKHVNLKRGSAEEARRLFAIAQKEGVSTTVGSLAQAIGVLKRKGGLGDLPASLAPEPVTLSITMAIDRAVEALNSIRQRAEELERDKDKIVRENDNLRASIQLMKEAFGKLGV